MKKALSLLLAAVMVLSLTACGGSKKDDSAATNNSGSGDAATYEFKLGTDCSDPALSPDYNGYGMQIAKFCELVNEKTNGQVTITPFWAASPSC